MEPPARRDEFSIRPASAADIDDILSVQVSAPESAQWTRATYTHLLTAPPATTSETPKQQRFLWCALLGEKVVGFLVATSLALSQGQECELENMAIDSARRRLGYGLRLVEFLLAWAQQQDVASTATTIHLEVRASNAAARMLYTKLGFHSSGLRKNYYSYPTEDAVLMEWRPEILP